jgi:hypothetical protein
LFIFCAVVKPLCMQVFHTDDFELQLLQKGKFFYKFFLK